MKRKTSFEKTISAQYRSPSHNRASNGTQNTVAIGSMRLIEHTGNGYKQLESQLIVDSSQRKNIFNENQFIYLNVKRVLCNWK